jgi:hypothetical protein
MTQFQFDAICKIIEVGAPALANDLCGALQGLVQSYNAALEENAKLKAEKDTTADKAE